MSRMTKYPNESLWTIGNSGTSSLQLNLTEASSLPMGNTQDLCKSSKCAEKPCAHTSYWKKKVFPFSFHWGQLSVHGGGGAGGRHRRLGSVLLLADTLQNESVVENKLYSSASWFEHIPEKEVLGDTVPVHLPCALLGPHTPHALASWTL